MLKRKNVIAVIAASVLCIGSLFLVGCAEENYDQDLNNGTTTENNNQGSANNATTGDVNFISDAATAEYVSENAIGYEYTAPTVYSAQLDPPQEGETIAVMNTSMGTIKLKFLPQYAPLAVENFIVHADTGYYDGVIFHRVMNDFMIQTGDPLGTGGGGTSIWGIPFADEFHPNARHHRGALAMAKPPGPNTNGSQFYIVQAATGTPWLNDGHTVFGHVIEGMDVVDAIAGVATTADRPNEDIVIESIEIQIYGS